MPEPTSTRSKIGDIVTSVKRGASSFYLKDGDTETPVIKAKDITDDGTINLTSVDIEKTRTIPRVRANLLAEGDILVSIRGGIFKSAIVPKDAVGYSFNANFIALTPDTDKIRPEILAWYLGSPFVLKYLAEKSTGHAIMSISSDEILNLPLSLPNKKQQEKIQGFLTQVRDYKTISRRQEEILSSISDELLMRYIVDGE